jgi:hypothetical protein
MPVKGVLTAHLLYDDPSERPISDIDLRVTLVDYPALLRVARSCGWGAHLDSPRLWEVVLNVDDWAVDVESTVSHPGLCAIPVARMLDRARSCIAPFGFPHLQPELHDHVLLLALNAFKDGLRPRPWSLEDLLRIVRLPEFSPALLVERAHEGRVATAVWLVANWLSRDHAPTPWEAVRSLLGDAPESKCVAITYRATLRRWSPKVGYIVTASASDAPLRSVLGLGATLAGVMRRRLHLLRSGLQGTPFE